MIRSNGWCGEGACWVTIGTIGWIVRRDRVPPAIKNGHADGRNELRLRTDLRAECLHGVAWGGAGLRSYLTPDRGPGPLIDARVVRRRYVAQGGAQDLLADAVDRLFPQVVPIVERHGGNGGRDQPPP